MGQSLRFRQLIILLIFALLTGPVWAASALEQQIGPLLASHPEQTGAYVLDKGEEALLALDQFCDRWDDKYPQISRSWRTHWHNLNTLFNYPEDIRRAIYTTNAIESLNSVIRKAIKKRKLFPTDDSAKKVIYLAVQAASKKWTMPIRNWKLALNRFMIEFEDRLADYI